MDIKLLGAVVQVGAMSPHPGCCVGRRPKITNSYALVRPMPSTRCSTDRTEISVFLSSGLNEDYILLT